jgi:hypothetical protein
MAELRTKHARKQATDRFCFPLITGTRGIQGDHFRDRPEAELSLNGLNKQAMIVQTKDQFYSGTLL